MLFDFLMETLQNLSENPTTPQKPPLISPPTLSKSFPKLKKWTQKEDNLLEKCHKRLGNKWKTIANFLKTRTASQCSQRFRRKFKPQKTRKPWTASEDEQVRNMVRIHGKNWQKISCLIKNRSGKQIRDRYTNYLDENVKKEPWTKEEDQILLENYRGFGAKWAKFSKLIPGRPENSIKNRFHSVLKKLINSEKSEKNENFNEKGEKTIEKYNENPNEKLEKYNEKHENIKKTSEKLRKPALDPERTIKKPLVFNELQPNTIKNPLKTEKKASFSEEEKENFILLKPYEFISSEENSFTGLQSSSKREKTQKKKFSTLNSFLPHDILNLRGDNSKSSSSELSLKLKKSSSSGSDGLNLNKLQKKESFCQ